MPTYRLPEELPTGPSLLAPLDYKPYKPVTNSLFQDLFSSSEFPNEEFAKVENFDTNL